MSYSMLWFTSWWRCSCAEAISSESSYDVRDGLILISHSTSIRIFCLYIWPCTHSTQPPSLYPRKISSAFLKSPNSTTTSETSLLLLISLFRFQFPSFSSMSRFHSFPLHPSLSSLDFTFSPSYLSGIFISRWRWASRTTRAGTYRRRIEWVEGWSWVDSWGFVFVGRYGLVVERRGGRCARYLDHISSR